MSTTSEFVIKPLGRRHNRVTFSCGVAELDVYFQQRAGQDVRRRLTRVFVAIDDSAPSRLLGFYTLGALSVAAADLPHGLAKRLPRHPLPGALIGRLAVDMVCQGTGLGGLLLSNAIARTLSVTENLAVFAMIVDAKDLGARRFYEHYGFVPFPRTPMRLYLPLADVVA